MQGGRISLKEGGEFKPREWLRREVLWASLMSPYSQQLDSWVNGTALPQHAGNQTRQNTYNLYGPSMESLEFFNHGKNVAGLVSSVALFDACLDKPAPIANITQGSSVTPLEIQARSVDRVLERLNDQLHIDVFTDKQETELFDECSDLAAQARRAEHGAPSRNEAFIKAGSIMARLAVAEAAQWLEKARQNPENSLPELVIDDGGTPRSRGERVNRCQRLFREMIASELYVSLYKDYEPFAED